MATGDGKGESQGFMATSAPGAQQQGAHADAAHAVPGELIGNWRIEEALGSGGMGSVYRAARADGLYEQDVALKIMAPGDARRAERFMQERQMLARLEHPNIARIIDGGTDHRGRPYLAMELVDGVPIDQHPAGQIDSSGRENTRDAVRLLRQLCAALAHAHRRLVLHRDIKPDNVLVDGGGHLRLVDFGISASLDNADDTAALTPGFAAPEQLSGEPATIASDIFATGCLSHVLLAGSLPQRRADGGVMIDRAALDDADLAAILERATATDQAQRYSGVAALDEDFAAWLDRRPVSARDGGTAYHLQRFIQRYPVGVALGSLALVALVAGLTASMIFAHRARSERDAANAALARAEWGLERADANYLAQSAYADLVQRLFGDETDVERQTELLLERSREAQARAAEEPDNAAYISYAVGRHFLFRNDYLTARKVLEPWLEADYGPGRVRNWGRQVLAVAYMSSGEPERAEPLLRSYVAELGKGFDAHTPDHGSAASQLAGITREPADAAAAEDILVATMAKDLTEPGIILYHWFQIARMRDLQGDFAGGYEAMKRADALVDDNSLGEISGRDTAKLALAEYELYHTGDDAAAAALIARARTVSEARGKSRELALVLAREAELAARRGDLRTAEAGLREALPLAIRFTSEGSETSDAIRLALARVLAQSGRHAEADDMLASVKNDSPALMLARLAVAAERGGASRAMALLGDPRTDRAAIGQSPELAWRYARLKRSGVRLP